MYEDDDEETLEYEIFLARDDKVESKPGDSVRPAWAFNGTNPERPRWVEAKTKEETQQKQNRYRKNNKQTKNGGGPSRPVRPLPPKEFRCALLQSVRAVGPLWVRQGALGTWCLGASPGALKRHSQRPSVPHSAGRGAGFYEGVLLARTVCNP